MYELPDKSTKYSLERTRVHLDMLPSHHPGRYSLALNVATREDALPGWMLGQEASVVRASCFRVQSGGMSWGPDAIERQRVTFNST